LNNEKKRKPPSWDERFKELVDFKAINDHTNVPQGSGPLGSWVNHQREAFRQLEKGKHSPLINERREKLDSIGFLFKCRPAPAGPNPRKRKKERAASGTVVLQEIRSEQKKDDLVFPRSRFSRLVRETTEGITKQPYRWERGALDTLQYASEDHLVKMFGGACLEMLHAKRLTMWPEDIKVINAVTTHIEPESNMIMSSLEKESRKKP
jgi:histone H3/H4